MIRDDDVDRDVGGHGQLGHAPAQLVQALAGARGDEHRAGQRATQLGQRQIGAASILLTTNSSGAAWPSCSATTSRSTCPHRVDLPHRVGVGAVDDVQEQVGVGDLLQRRAERLDELVRQVPDEARRCR